MTSCYDKTEMKVTHYNYKISPLTLTFLEINFHSFQIYPLARTSVLCINRCENRELELEVGSTPSAPLSLSLSLSLSPLPTYNLIYVFFGSKKRIFWHLVRTSDYKDHYYKSNSIVYGIYCNCFDNYDTK